MSFVQYLIHHVQGSSREKKLKRGGVVLRSMQKFMFLLTHIKDILPQKGGVPPSLARSLMFAGSVTWNMKVFSFFSLRDN